MYQYLCGLREEGRPASARKAVMEAVTFARFVLGIPELAALGESKRCHGSAKERDFKERKQASPFKVDELVRLHEILAGDREPWNRLMAGALLFATYARARWEDLSHADVLIIDRGENGEAAFIEAGVGVHKTMGAKLMKGQLLPMVAPAVGVTSDNWVEQFLSARRALGVADPPHSPVMPAPDSQGFPTIRSLESDEAGSWARLLLFGSVEPVRDRRVSSHSCKCTCISFATKFGASPSELLLLGYHTGDFKMPLTYGRDAAAPTLMLLNKVLLWIRSGRFRPDATRSGRFMKSSERLVIDIKDEDEHLEVEGPPARPEARGTPSALPEEASVESGAENTGSSSSSDSDQPEAFSRRSSFAGWVIPDPPEGMRYYEHSKSRVLHVMQDQYSKVFACGRAVGVLHRRLEDRPAQACSRCRLCARIADSKK